MDEARAVLDRLERIDALQLQGAPARALLDEIRHLLVEAEAWVRLDGDERTERALDRCKEALGARILRA